MDLDQAVELLSKHPALPLGTGIVIRPIHETIDRRWHDQKTRLKPD
jgi:hypothetical protein